MVLLDASRRQRQKVRNAAQGVLLLIAMIAVVALLAWLLFGAAALAWVVVAGVLLGGARPRVPAQWVLSMYNARPLPRHAAPELHRIVEVLAYRAGLSRPPALYYVPSPISNAFAVGCADDGALAVTQGLLRRLTTRQLAGVLAHEISHIRAGDTTIMSLSDSIARLAQVLSYLGIWSIALTLPWTLARDATPLLVSAGLIALPTVVTLMQLGLSRSREFDADLGGVSLTGDPEGLAQGLEALERAEGPIWERTMVPHGRSSDPAILRTHPATAERVRRLRALSTLDPPARLGGDHRLPTHGYPACGTPRLRAPGIRW